MALNPNTPTSKRFDPWVVVTAGPYLQVLYVMQIEASLKTEKAAVVSMAHYAMTLPILSTGFVAVERSKFNPTTLMEDTSKDSVIDYFSYDDDSKTG